MKRYYLSKIKLVDVPGFGPVWRHRLQELSDTMPIDYVGGEIAVDPNTGIPTQKALLVLVGGVDHQRLRGDPELVPLPAVAADTKVSAIHTPTKVGAKAAIRALGFTQQEVDAAWDNADGLRDVLNHYGKKNNPAFDADKFDVDES